MTNQKHAETFAATVARGLAGAIAGFGACGPMTAHMIAAHKLLPGQQRYELPPRQIIMGAAKAVGAHEEMGEPARMAATLVGHFGYAAATGSIYGIVAAHIPLPPALAGAAFGMATWAGSYLGWLPAMGVLPPATEESPQRNALMITAHLVWGAVLGQCTARLLGGPPRQRQTVKARIPPTAPTSNGQEPTARGR